MPQVDVLVVGAGPIGIETAVVLSGEGHSVLVIDEGPVGATIARTFPPATRFFTSPERLEMAGHAIAPVAQEKITGEEYLAYLRGVVAASGITVRTYCRVVGIAGSEGDFTVDLQSGAGAEQVTAAVIVLAHGGTHRSRRLGVPGEDLPHVHRHLGDPHRFFQRRVLVVGGRNSAAESALRLYRVGADVTLSYRRSELAPNVKFWIRPEVVSLIAEDRIHGLLPSTVSAVQPAGVTFTDGRRVEVDDVLLQLGFEQDPALFELAGIATDPAAGGAPMLAEATLATTVPGIFVVGTATAGTQDHFGVFIENSHQHAHRVAAALAGRPAPEPMAARPLPEM